MDTLKKILSQLSWAWVKARPDLIKANKKAFLVFLIISLVRQHLV
jgi:hypothetical protein